VVVDDHEAIGFVQARAREVDRLVAREDARIARGVAAQAVEENAREVTVGLLFVPIGFAGAWIARVVEAAGVVQPVDRAPLRVRDAIRQHPRAAHVVDAQGGALVAAVRNAKGDVRAVVRCDCVVERGVRPVVERIDDRFVGRHLAAGFAIVDEQRRSFAAAFAQAEEDTLAGQLHGAELADGQ
jgi:hypothetical protein